VELVETLARHCACEFTAQHLRASACASHEMLISDQRPHAVTVTLAAGTYAAEWHNLTTRETRGADQVTVERDARVSFTAPFPKPGPAVLHLERNPR
jgi:hypothetical protein